MAWDGVEQREHDLYCREKMDKCKQDVFAYMDREIRTQICLATKGTKIWNKYMRPILTLLLAGAIAGHFMPASSQGHDHLEDVKLDSRLGVIENAHENMASDLEDVKDDIETIEKAQFIQIYIMKEMAKEYNIRIPDPE